MITSKRDGSVSFVGAVIGTTSSVDRIMSDVWAEIFYAMCWDGEKVIKVSYADDSGLGVRNSVVIDATPDVLAAARTFLIAEEVRRLNYEYDGNVNAVINDARRTERGKTVVVSRGRKVAKGTTGRVFWMGDNGWGLSVGIECANGDRVFTAEKNVDVVNPDEYLDIDALRARPDYSVRAANAADKLMLRYNPTMEMAA